MNSGLYLLSVFVHILAAAFWTGGMLFLALILVPAIKNHPERKALFHKTAVRFRAAGYISLAAILFTGLYNMHSRGISFNPAVMAGTFQGMMALKKLGIFILTLLISFFHDYHIGKKALATNNNNPGRTTLLLARWMGRFNLLLALAAIALGIVMVRGWY